MSIILFCFLLLTLASADDPITDLSPHCPPSNTGYPTLQLLADVPAHGLAKCKNGDKSLAVISKQEHRLPGAFDQSYNGVNCLFYKKKGINTYTVDVEIGWGKKDSEVINRKLIRTLSCAYDQHGKALSVSETIAESFIAPQESQRLLGTVSKATFKLQLMDVLGREIKRKHVSTGRKMRLKATDVSDTVFFRAISCVAKNEVSSYAVLRAGCGDGLVFAKTAGFETKGREVFSPYFQAFKLQGPNFLQFQCNFTECASSCDGSSCLTEDRRRRALSEDDQERERMQELMSNAVIHDGKPIKHVVDTMPLLMD